MFNTPSVLHSHSFKVLPWKLNWGENPRHIFQALPTIFQPVLPVNRQILTPLYSQCSPNRILGHKRSAGRTSWVSDRYPLHLANSKHTNHLHFRSPRPHKIPCAKRVGQQCDACYCSRCSVSSEWNSSTHWRQAYLANFVDGSWRRRLMVWRPFKVQEWLLA